MGASHPRETPFVRGGALALLAACAFGATTPLVQRFGKGVGPLSTASLLYAGAALACAAPGVRGLFGGGESGRVGWKHAPRVVLVAVAGALVAPACLAWGVQRTSAVGASLLLNLEGLFTVLLAWVVHRESIGARAGAALAVIAAGGALLVGAGGEGSGATSAAGAAAVVVATLAWALDNTLTRPLSELEPSGVVLMKGALWALFGGVLGYVFAEPSIPVPSAVGLLVCGATGYGLSLRLYLQAQRVLGAARTASIFAAAPFVGALVAVALGDRPPAMVSLVAAALCALGVWLHLTEHHAHAHTHDVLEHDHLHRHDDGHHGHRHEPPFAGEHAHPHRHDAVTHEHEHAPDLHHGHGHG